MKTNIKSTILLVLLLTAMIITQSCNKIKLSKDVSWSGVDVTVSVPIVPDNQLHGSMGTGSFTYNLDSAISAKTNGVFGVSSISKVTLSSCIVKIANPDQANNFANFELCDLFFNTDKNPVTAHTATIENNPDVYADSLNIPVDNTIDLKSYLYSSTNTSPTITFTYVVGGKLRRPTTKALTLNVHVEYTIHVQQN